MRKVSSWGNTGAIESPDIDPTAGIDWNGSGTFLPFGLGRSYGDCCLNKSGAVIITRRLDRFISFDADTGVLTCQAGVSLAEILEIAVPRGWFIAVTPGTKFVTVGGAIANDVHGKNHHCSGTFGNFVESFELLRSDGSRTLCSRDSNSGLFYATIGGMGLTGLILSATIRLRKTDSPFFSVNNEPFTGLKQFREISQKSVGCEYTVAWLDCASKGAKFGRGVFMAGNHSGPGGSASKNKSSREVLTVPFTMPPGVLNRYGIRFFNSAYFYLKGKSRDEHQHYESFFYPLDVLGKWNRLYGRRGFFQFQCVVPFDNGCCAAETILKSVKDSPESAYLTVLKEFGDISSGGMMSFPRRGITLCMDFPNRGESTLRLLRRLDEIVRESGGAIYPAKDAVMPPESFAAYYPAWREFVKFKDPKFSSAFWERVTAGQEI